MGRDVFTRMVHGIRLRYAVVGVAFLALVVTLFRLGGPRAFGWYDFIAVFVLILMVLTLFLMQCHYVIAPIERLTGILNELLGKTLAGAEPLRIQWNGKDEFACLAAAMNGLLETVESRSAGLLEENRRLKDVVSVVEAELVVMNGSGSVLRVVHCPSGMRPVPGLRCGTEPDREVWSGANGQALKRGLDAACRGEGVQTVDLAFAAADETGTRRLRAVIRRPENGTFPLVAFRDVEGAPPVVQVPSDDRKVSLSRIAAGVNSDLQKVFAEIRSSAARYENVENPEVRETIATIYGAVRSGMAMMDDLVTLGGEMRMRMQRIGVADLIADVRKRAEEVFGGSGIRISYDIAPNLPPVTLDRAQMVKAFMNLVRNAVEAYGAVSGTVRVQARPFVLTGSEDPAFCPCLAPGKGLLLSVSDNGPGMPSHVLAHAFEPYCTTKSNGRGLGLPIADSILAAHGGGMRCVSSSGTGTTIEMFLPVSERPSEESERIRREFPNGEVLIVDDNRMVLRITSALLRTQKIAAHAADCRADALRKFGDLSERLRAVFLDAQLGDETTVGLLGSMRAENPRVPIVVVSGYTKGEIDAIFIENPPDAFLMKPYTVDELKNLLASLKIGSA